MNIKVVIFILLFSVALAQHSFVNMVISSLFNKLSNDIKGVTKNDIKFSLYNTQNPTEPVLISTKSTNLSDVVNLSEPFKFIVHGYTYRGNITWMLDIKDEYLKKGKYNIVLVNWAKPSSHVYPISASNTKPVGKYVGKLLIYLNKTHNVPYENFHLICHSLGAHVAGFAGKYLIKKVKRTFGRLTGMDPAGPNFVGNSIQHRLNKNDADFVDIIHTDGNSNGYFFRLGHVDFYVNGGVPLQPGCLEEPNIVAFATCSHVRSHAYFTESINSEKFIAKECGNYLDYKKRHCSNNSEAIMGENVNLSTQGKYYLTTNAKPPFARDGLI